MAIVCLMHHRFGWREESLSDVIRLLVAGELFFLPDYYVQTIKDRFLEAENSIPFSEATVFSTILTEAGEKEMTSSKNQVEAVRAEARNTCIKDNWNGMIQMLALATVLKRPVFSIYPEANPGLRPIFHWKILPRMAEESTVTFDQIQIIWTRDGNLDPRSNAVFQPNHFVPVVISTDADVPAKKKEESVQPPKKKPGKRDISSFFKSGNEDHQLRIEKKE